MRSLFTHLFKQLVSVNQTNETVSRDYRKGVISWLSAGHLLCATYNRGTTRFFRLAAMVTLLLTLACANVWGGTPITWTASSSDVATLVGKNKVTVGSGTQTFDVWAVRAKVDASNTPAISYDGGVKLNDNAINKSGVAVYIPSGVDDIESIEFYLKTSSSRKTYYASGSSCPSSGTVTGSALATSFTAYDFWSGGTYNKNYYYAIGGKSGGGGEVYIQKIVVTFADAAPSTKTIYMKAGAWNTDNPKFYVHSWGSSNNDVLMTLADCETDVYYADIPSGNTSILFTRQDPSSSGIKYKDQTGNWNQSLDITISTNDLFTFSAWDGGGGKSSFTGGTYSAPTYTITYAAGGGTGSMTATSGIACGADQALPANTFTKSGYVFDGWKANVAVTIGGSSVAANTKFAGGSTLQNITSNITLTAQWAESSCPDDGTVYSAAVKSTVSSNQSFSANSTTEVNASTQADITGGKLYAINGESSAKDMIKSSGGYKFCMPNNSTRFKIEMDCALQEGDVITIDGVGGTKNSDPIGLWVSSSESRPGSAPACSGTSTTESLVDDMVNYTITSSDEYHGKTILYIHRAVGASTYFNNINITRSSSCTAPTALAAASTTAKGTTFTVTDGADTNDYEFYVSTSNTAPTSGSSATHTSTSKTKTITDCVAGTTYYAWVRSKCDVSSKSEWTALTGNTFTTSQVTVTHTLTNVTATSGATGANAAGGSDYTAVFAAVSGYSLPTPTVTIDGNTATSGTDYTWTAGTGTLTIPANKINGNIVITLNSAAAAPSSVAIGNNWLWFAGETMTLTATPTGGNGPITYQWYKGGKADGNAIDGATNATFSKTCAFEDAGSYYCKVTCGGTESTWGKNGDAYEVKVPRLYVKTGRNDGVKSDYGNVDFTRVDASTATASISLGSNWDYCFNIADGCGHYYGNAGTMQYNNYGPWVTNVNNQDCGLRTTNGATYVFTINYSNWAQVTTTVTFPSSNQAADKVIYFDNNDRQWSNLHYRIGRGDHTQAAALTLVPGTANLYKYTTVAYNNFAGWHIANNSGWTGSNTIYRTYTNGDQYSITYATAHEGGAVTQAAVTVTPTTSRGAGSDAGINDNCTFYNYEITTGMKTQNVSITAPSNGTITVSYTDVNNAAQSFTSGNADLAHTVIITPTVTPATGYQLSGLTVNGNAHTPGNTYTVTGTTVVAATFSLIDYTVTLNTNGGTINAGNVTSYNYGTGATLPTNVTKDGYIFDGWFDNSGLTGSAVTTISSSATGNKEFWAKWTCVTPTITTNLSTSTVNYNVGDAATALSVAATAAGGSVSYQWYSNTANSTTTPTPTALTTGTSYTPSTAAAGTTYYFCVITNSTAGCSTTATSNITPVTVTAVVTPIITYNIKVTGTGTTIKGSDPTTTDGTNISTLNIVETNAGASGDPTGSNRSTKIAIKTGANGADWSGDPTNYVLFKFKVACGKKFTPSKIHIPVANVGSASANNIKYKAVMSDSFGHTLSGTYIVTTQDGTVEDFDINNADASKYFQGEVTLKLWAWTITNTKNGGSAFRMGTPVTIFGEVGTQATPAATITWTTQPASGTVGDDDFAYAVSCSDGSTVTVTSNNTSVATIVGGKLHYAAAGTTYLIASATDACGNAIVQNSNNFTVSVPATYDVTFSLTNVAYSSGDNQGIGAATEGSAFSTVFVGSTGYNLPSTITVTIDGDPATVGTDYTWTQGTGTLTIPGAKITGDITVSITGEEIPATKDIYYGHVKITDGALVREIPSGATQFFTNIGGTVANNTEISLSSTPSTTGMYYNSNNLTDAELSKSSNWSTSSGSNRYIRGLKFANGTTYTLALGSKVASSIKFYGWCGSASKTMTVGGEEYVSSATKNTFGTNTFVKSGGFTGNVSITQDGDFYGILVITIQTATPCTTPVIPALSNQSLCEGTDIAEWDATQTAVLADGETVTYSWKKKGNDTELANTATFDLGSSATESQAGTYVVTVTVSKAGKASSSAYREVELSVTDGEEVTSIVADKATVYPGNSVTLTATANTPATWQWYTCTNSAGDGEDDIDGATSASYTIASAGAAGTYYYKAVATGSCGTAERVYTLTVTAASECQNYYWFIYADDATANGVINNRDGFFSNTTTGTGNTGTYTMTVDGTSMTGTKRLSTGAYKPKFTVPAGATATLYIYGKAASSDAGKHLVLKRTSDDEEVEVTSNTTVQAYTKEDIEPGEWTLSCGSSNWCYSFFAVKVCSTSSCTDATPTIAAVNNTVCSGTKMRIDATGYETGATFKWQKLNTSTSSWDDVAGATLDSLVIASVTASNAGSYRFIATKECARTSNTVTISVPSAPDFGSTVPSSVSVMQTIALSINTVEATDATKYRWYKSANTTWDAGDTEIGTNKELIKAYDGEAIGSPSYYVICRAQNSCGTTTSSAIAVNVTTYVEEDCATRGNEGDAEFSFENSGAGQGSYESTACWTMNSNSKILVYYPPTGKYFKTAKVTIASSSESKASYNWSTNGGTSYTAVRLDISTTLTERTIDLSAHGNVDAFQIGRNFDSKGSSGGTLYVSKICFEYTEACTATTVTPSTASVNYEMGGAWSNPTFTLTPAAVSGETLTYSSSNEDIASVDDDGTVTFNGEAGTVTITASYAGGTISATDYCASSGSYTITVSCPGGAPKIVADGSTDMSGCNTSVTLHAKQSDGISDFADGTYQWFRNGTEIDDATSSSYTATQAGTYTVARTNGTGCTTPSTNSAIVTSETTEPEVERLVPFQYYHVDKTYTDQMKMRHLFAVKNSGTLDGKSFKMYVSRSGGAATDVTSSNALVVVPNGDGHVDTVMVDLNKLSGKYSEDDELVFTCKAIDCSGNVSEVYKNTITMRVIGTTPTLALICSGSSKAEGTRNTGELTVGGDFLTGYNVADLCVQTGKTSFDKTQEWGLYTELKEEYIVTPVNGYAPFYKLNYEPFDILFLTDYPKASKSDAAKDILDDMAALCDYRPLFSFKTHMVAKSPSKWAAKGFTTSATENKADGRLNLNIVCYAHPMFDAIKTGDDVYNDTENTSAPLIYTMLSGTGHEGSKGMQGFEIAAAENFVTIGLTHYNATIAKVGTNATWTPSSEDRMLVTVAERQTNIEARMILFSLNAGAHSKLTDKGEQVVLACLRYLLDDDPLHVADCSFTFDNGASNEHNAAWYAEHCPGCTGTAGDGKWSTAANWAPDYRLLPGEFTSVRIAAPVTVDMEHAHVLDARIKEGGHITIPAGKALEMKGTIRRLDGSEISPTENEDIFLASNASGNGSLIFNNDKGDSKATVAMYTTALADIENMSATTSTWQYIGTPHNDVARATYNYYDSWLYQYSGSGWEVIPNGGPLVPFRGYCVTHPQANHTFVMYGTLTATTNVDIDVPAGYTVIANSWVAPIDITTLTNDDMEGIDDKTIYFFNTGSDAEGENGTGTAPGTYVAVPKNAASYVGNWQIPSMQGFYLSSSSAGTLHLDYGRHVRPAGERTTIVNNPMYAPRRAKAADEEPLVLKMFARGSRYHDKLVVLERADFTTGYDSGWDGEAWGGSDLSPQIYVIGGGRYDAVSAIPDFEGTVVAFRAGEDEEYTIDFIYDAENEPLYLFDTENNSYTQIVTDGAYHFTTSDKAEHSRFILTRHAPQIATGCENLDGGEGAKAKKLLIEDKMFIMVNGLLYDATGKVVK